MSETDLFESGPLAMFNKIYKEHYDEKGFTIDDKPEFRSVYDTLVKFGMPTDNFVENLKTLAIKKVPNSSTHESYIPTQNKLEYCNPDYIKHGLFHVASADGKPTTGVSFRTKAGGIAGTALKEGIVELFSKLNDPNYACEYPFEKMCAEALMYSYGEKIFIPHFDADPAGFLEQFPDRTTILNFIAKLDKYQKHYEESCKLIIDGKYDEIPASTYMLNFYFNSCLMCIAELYFQSGQKDNEAFKRFIDNGFKDPEMEQVMMLVTKFGTMEVGSDSFRR